MSVCLKNILYLLACSILHSREQIKVLAENEIAVLNHVCCVSVFTGFL